MIGIVLSSIYLILVGYFYGRILQKLCGHLIRNICWIPFGVFIYLGILQVLNYALISFGTDAAVMEVLYFGLGLVSIPAAFLINAELKPRKVDWIALIAAIAVIALGVYRASNYTYGESGFDSTFYMSMVLEKSAYTRFDMTHGYLYYTGAPADAGLILYDYQAFYILESLFLKVSSAFFGITDLSLVLVYTWGSTVTYLALFGMVLVNVGGRVFRNKKMLGLLWFSLSSYICFRYYDYALAFFGNSWRSIALACYGMFLFTVLKRRKYTIPNAIMLGLLLNGLIACSSSGLFISVFLLVSFLAQAVYRNADQQEFRCYLIQTLMILPYAIIEMQLKSLLPVILILACFALYYAVFFLCSRSEKGLDIFYRIQKVLILVILAGIIVYSYFIQKGSEYPYSFFFEAHSVGDMVPDFFLTSDYRELAVNVLLWTIVVIYFVRDRRNRAFRFGMLAMIVIFLNPLTLPFVIKYLSNFVYYRAYDALFNVFTIAIFVSGLSELNHATVLRYASGVLSAALMFLAVLQYQSWYTAIMKPDDNFNHYYRLSSDKIDVLEHLQTEIDSTEKRDIVLSQVTATKGFLREIQSVFKAQDLYNVYKYDTMKPEASSELLNIFTIRDYTDQHVYQTDPDYTKTKVLINEAGINYLVLLKNQTTMVNGEYWPIFFYARDDADVIYQNDSYVIIKTKNP